MTTTGRTSPRSFHPRSNLVFNSVRGILARAKWLFLLFTILTLAVATSRAGLTLELHLYRTSGGDFYAFYTPLYTNSLAPDAPLGTYIIQSPHQPTNGSVRGFLLGTNGISDIGSVNSEQFYHEFNAAIFQITNGDWTLLFTNATTTNIFHFTISAPTMSSNMLPATVANFPTPGLTILTNETNFSWQGPTAWPTTEFGQVFNSENYYTQAVLPAGQTNWNVASSLPPHPNYNFLLRYLYTNTLFSITTPIDTVSSQPFPGWDSDAVLETGLNIAFSVVTDHGVAAHGHTLLANYTFEDNNLIAHDFSGAENNMRSYAWFSVPPTIVTNDAAAGTYAGGLSGSGWFFPSDSLRLLFAKSFSVSLWLKTTNIYGSDTAGIFDSAGVISDLGSDYSQSAAPMLQSGHKLSFFTGGDTPNMLYSQADINTGQYIHVVTTRDQQT